MSATIIMSPIKTTRVNYWSITKRALGRTLKPMVHGMPTTAKQTDGEHMCPRDSSQTMYNTVR